MVHSFYFFKCNLIITLIYRNSQMETMYFLILSFSLPDSIILRGKKEERKRKKEQELEFRKIDLKRSMHITAMPKENLFFF
jgi:hypothetical protein